MSGTSGTKASIGQRHAQLQQQIRALHAAVAACDPDDDAYAGEYERLVEATRDLLAFEQQMPELLAEPERAVSERIVRWSWRGQAVLAAALVACVFVLDCTWWWLLLLLPYLAGTVAGSFQTIRVTGHRSRRNAAIALHAVAVLVVLLFFGLLPMWLLAVIIPGWLGVAVTSSEDPGNTGPKGQR
ncbi:hypothetical protein ACIG3E_23535 [Streptomyces sp. NPDC053474]|uniref:hypothetical protein n=1 Tax=Streptomyces sp. NPDC053474 TaxID=3365704 RepID=UPI0037D50E53